MPKKVSDPLSVKSLLKVLGENKGGNDHKCMNNGYITIVKRDVKTKLELVPSHGKTEVEFRFGGELYTVPLDKFFSIQELLIFKAEISKKMDSQLEK